MKLQLRYCVILLSLLILTISKLLNGSNLKKYDIQSINKRGNSIDKFSTYIITDSNFSIPDSEKVYIDFNSEESWESCYENSPELIDSVKLWKQTFNFIEQNLEIKNIIRVCGKRFYQLPLDTISEHLVNDVFKTYAKDSILSFEYWERKISEYNRRNIYVKPTLLSDKIWDVQSIYLDIPNISLQYFQTYHDSVYNNLISEIEWYFQPYVQRVPFVVDTNQLNLFIKRAKKFKNWDEGNEAMFLLAVKLYFGVYKNYIPRILELIESRIHNDYAHLNNAQRAFWYVALAKMNTSLRSNFSSLQSYSNLKRAISILYENNKYPELIRQINILKADFWSMHSSPYSRKTALNSLLLNYQIDNPEIGQRMDYLSAFCKYNSNYLLVAKERKLPISQYEILQQANHISLCNLAIYLIQEDWTYKGVNVLHSLGNYYLLRNDWKKKRRVDYAMLKLILRTNTSLTSNFNLGSILYNEQILGDSLNIVKWNQYILGTIPQKIIPPNSVAWSKRDISRMTALYLDMPLTAFIGNNDYPFSNELRNNIDYLSCNAVKELQWEVAYKLLAKRDSIIEVNESPEYMFNLGYISGYDQENIVTGKLGYEKGLLSDEKVKLGKEIKKKQIENALLDGKLKEKARILAIKEDSINVINDSLSSKKVQLSNTLRDWINAENLAKSEKEAREEAERNMIIAGIIATLLLIVAIYAFYQQQKAKFEASINEYKSRIWQEFGHIPGTSIAYSYEMLSDEKVNKETIEPLILLNEMLQSLFNSLKQGSDSLSIGLKSEINLIKNYIKYYNTIRNKNIQLQEIGDIPDINVPPAILLSCIRNSINHGRVTQNPKSMIGIKVTESSNCHQVFIYDNGIGFGDLKNINDIKKGTGLLNASSILRFFNGNYSNNYIHFGKTQEDNYNTYVSITLIKRP